MIRRRKRRPRPDDLPAAAAHWSEQQLAEYHRQKKLDKPLADIDAMPVRLVNILERNGYLTVADLDGAVDEDLRAMGNFGDKAVQDVGKLIRPFGAEIKRSRAKRRK